MKFWTASNEELYALTQKYRLSKWGQILMHGNTLIKLFQCVWECQNKNHPTPEKLLQRHCPRHDNHKLRQDHIYLFYDQ